MNIRQRIVKLAGVIKQAQNANVGRGDYYLSTNETPEGSGSNRGLPGPYDGSPANASVPDKKKEESRLDRTMGYRTNDVSLSVVSRDGNQMSGGGGIHFGDVVGMSPSGEGVVTLF